MTDTRRTAAARLGEWLERHPLLLPLAILVLGAAFRFFNLNWDDGQQLHPDERWIYMVVSGANGNPPLGLPGSVAQFFDVRGPSGGSPLNPHFFAYGSLPFYMLAALSTVLAFLGRHLPMLSGLAQSNSYGGLPPVGRALSASLDTASLFILFLIGRRVFGYWTAVLGMALAAFTVLDIQLAHFYAVDTVLLPFVLLTMLASVHIVQTNRTRAYVWGGVVFGAALATKTTALLLVVPLFGAAALAAVPTAEWTRHGRVLDTVKSLYRRHGATLNANLQLLIATYVVAAFTFAVLEPYALLDRGQLLHDIAEQTRILVTNDPPFGVPYTVQYAHTTPYLFQLKNLLFWCMGIPLALAAFSGVVYYSLRTVRMRITPEILLLLVWVVPYFLFVGRFGAKFNRYLLPIVPVMTLLGAGLLVVLLDRLHRPVRFAAIGATALIVLVSFGYSLAYMNIYEHPNTRVEASRWMYSHIPAGAVVAVEGPWDDSLPLGIDGHTPNQFHQPAPNLDLYHGEDTLPDANAKIANITTALTTAQYIVMSSERMDRSIPRLPERYPITVRYYKLLFGNRLNFRLVQHFQRHPQLGPLVVHDYPADESFHVYDHPDVRIFKRVGSIIPARVRGLLTSGISVAYSTADGRPPAYFALPLRAVPDSRLMLTPSQWKADQKGPTVDSMFPPGGFAMKHPLLVWVLALELLGLLSFPLLFSLLGGLIDRGWLLAKTVGILIVGYLAWIGASVGLISFDRSTIWLAVILLALASALVAFRARAALAIYLRAEWRVLVVGEILFLVAFAFFIWLRMWYPDLGHQYSPVSAINEGAGRMGEKQMELAFLNAVVRSRVFPPLDPFFAHGYINYYYYGFVLVGALCKLTQIVPSTGFNLAVASFGAMLLANAFSVVHSLTRRITPGVLAAIFVGLIGNLAAAWFVVQSLMSVATMHSSLPLLGGVLDTISGLRAVLLNGQTIPAIDFWTPTRIIPGGAISEFPYFTYLFADLHPHLIAYPMTVAALAVAANLVLHRSQGRRMAGTVLLGGFLAGSIAATNPWDFPTYVLVLGIGAGVAAVLRHSTLRWTAILPPLGWTISAAVISWIAFLPFKHSYQTVFQTGIGFVRDITPELIGPSVSPSDAHDILVNPLRTYLEHFGFLLFGVATFLTYLLLGPAGTARWIRWLSTAVRFTVYHRDRLASLRRASRVAHRRFPFPPSPVDASGTIGLVIVVVGLLALRYYLLAFLIGLAGVIVLLLLRLGRQLTHVEVFTLVLVLLPIGLSFVTQLVFVKDFLAGGSAFRMNTIFKFYNQAWVLYAICAATSLYSFMNRRTDDLRSRESNRPAPDAPALPNEHAGTGPLLVSEVAFRDAPSVPAATITGLGALPVQAMSFSSGHAAASAHGSGPAEGQSGDALPSRSRRRKLPAITPAFAARPAQLAARHTVWALAFTALLLGSLMYTWGGTTSRENYRSSWLPQNSIPYTLDGMAFMKVAYPQDYAGIRWLQAHVSGAPVIAEAYDPANIYIWPSRVSMFTGLPTIINGIHEGEQRWNDELDPTALCSTVRDSATCVAHAHSRSTDIHTLYDSSSPADAWTVIHRYGIKYIFVGFVEQHCFNQPPSPFCYSKAGIAKFAGMVGHGLRVAFQAKGMRVYQVTSA